MGVPVLTLVGRTLQQRQASSILGMLGMSEWAAPSEQAYVEQAAAAAADLEALDRLRQGLRGSMTVFFQDSRPDLARELDIALQSMWRRWCAGPAPESFAVTS
jgi:predicted O-linked N-acetylglucosamine transferase (SPINDLY family)